MPAPRTVRHIRLALLVLVLVVGVSVTFTFLRSRSAVTPTPAPSAPPEGPTSARAERFEYKSFKGDKEGWFLRALNMVGQEQEDVRLRGVDLTFTYMAKGQPGKGRIVRSASGAATACSNERSGRSHRSSLRQVRWRGPWPPGTGAVPGTFPLVESRTTFSMARAR